MRRANTAAAPEASTNHGMINDVNHFHGSLVIAT